MSLACHLHADLFTQGWGVLLVVADSGAVAAFLLDVEVEGIRHVVSGRLAPTDVGIVMADFAALGTFPAQDPAQALRLLRDLAGWSVWVNGRPPPHAVRMAETLFGALEPAVHPLPHPPFGRSGGREPCIGLECYKAFTRLESKLRPLS